MMEWRGWWLDVFGGQFDSSIGPKVTVWLIDFERIVTFHLFTRTKVVRKTERQYYEQHHKKCKWCPPSFILRSLFLVREAGKTPVRLKKRGRRLRHRPPHNTWTPPRLSGDQCNKIQICIASLQNSAWLLKVSLPHQQRYHGRPQPRHLLHHP